MFMFSSSIVAYRLRAHVRQVMAFGFADAVVLVASPTTSWSSYEVGRP